MTLRHSRLPTHPRTGLTAIGMVRGRPVWPVMGGSQPTGEGASEGGSTDGEPAEAGKPETDGEKPERTRTFNQAEVDKLIEQRLGRERKKYGDYDDLKRKATEFDRLADEQKSETQRLAERAEKAEREAAESRTELLRHRVAASKGRPEIAKWLTGATEDEIAANADELLASLTTGKPSGPPPMDQGVRNTDSGKPSVAAGRDLWSERHKKTTERV